MNPKTRYGWLKDITAIEDETDGRKDIPFKILLDGKQSEYSENVEVGTTGNTSDTFRSLDFYVPESTKTISIVGTKSIL